MEHTHTHTHTHTVQMGNIKYVHRIVRFVRLYVLNVRIATCGPYIHVHVYVCAHSCWMYYSMGMHGPQTINIYRVLSLTQYRTNRSKYSGKQSVTYYNTNESTKVHKPRSTMHADRELKWVGVV